MNFRKLPIVSVPVTECPPLPEFDSQNIYFDDDDYILEEIR
jgi:hypothetical protein